MLQNLNIARCALWLANSPLTFLKEMLEKFRVVTKEKRITLNASCREAGENCNAFLELMKSAGSNPEGYLPWIQQCRVLLKRQPRPGKYRFADFNGEEKARTGQVVRLNKLPGRWRREISGMIS